MTTQTKPIVNGSDMLQTVQAAIRQAAQSLGYSQQRIQAALEAEAEHIFTIELQNGKKFPAYRVQHSSTLGPHKGGIRFHPQVSLDEVRALATLMSLKAAVAGLPLGGGKGGIAVDVTQLSQAELEELSRRYARHLAPHLGPHKDIPAPDVNTNAQIMDWMVDELAQTHGADAKASLTGKSVGNGGSLGREAATGRGSVIALMDLLAHLGKTHQEQTVALQGFGNVGYHFAKILQAEYPHIRIVAIADSRATAYKPDGFTIDSASKDGHTPKLAELHDFAIARYHEPDAILSQPVDILVLAALENAIHDQNMQTVQARIVVELANGPVTQQAHDYLTAQRGTIILPDIIANAGGVVVSYLEWQQNLSGEHWPEHLVNDKLAAIMHQSLGDILHHYDSSGKTLKQAAFEVAVQKLLG